MPRGGAEFAGPRARARLRAVGALSTALAVAGSAAAEPAVRVLLAEGAASARIEAAGRSAPALVRPGPRRGLRVGGRERGAALRLAGPGPHAVDGRHYRGVIEVSRAARGLRVVNEVPLEAYVAGTLLGEVHEAWGAAVLQAQAVAARTYALHRRARAAGRDWDLEASTRGQVYLGADGESEAAWAAVDATRGQVLAFGGELILAAFHATAGGRTASAEEVWGEPLPYLVSVAVEGEDLSPDTYWRAPVSAEELGRNLEGLGHRVGRVAAVEMAERTPSGRCAALLVRGSRGAARVPAADLRRALGEARLRSTLFEVRPAADGFVFVGSGRGHGVGMSQWGARALAGRGADYRAILHRFYPGARLERIAAEPAELAAKPAGAASRRSW
jgi:stage II sporulation protein D